MLARKGGQIYDRGLEFARELTGRSAKEIALRAIISDIHANLEALEAVLDDIARQNVTEIYCLGDIIGYGPNPRECIDLIEANCKLTILGNHDQGALFDPEGFNSGAERAIFWTREQLEAPVGEPEERADDECLQ